ALLRTAESMASQAGDEQTLAVVLQFLGNLARGQGDLGSAGDLYAAARDLNRRLESPVWEAMSLVGQGQAAADQGRPVEAEGFALARELGDRLSIARAFEGIATLSTREPAEANVRLAAAASTLRAAIGATQGLTHWAPLETILDAARHALGASAYERAWASGGT